MLLFKNSIINWKKKLIFRTKTGPREFEINKLNNTIQIGVDLQIFTYYWKIEHFSEKLKSNISTINSPIFSISGLFLRVTATLNHLGRDYLHLQLEQVTSGKGTDKSNIILKTGDLFKKIQTKVEFKHKIAILDQVSLFWQIVFSHITIDSNFLFLLLQLFESSFLFSVWFLHCWFVMIFTGDSNKRSGISRVCQYKPRFFSAEQCHSFRTIFKGWHFAHKNSYESLKQRVWFE